MSLELKVSIQKRTDISAQQQKINRLIEQIEQQKQDLICWQNARNEIQSYLHQKLVPLYGNLHTVLFNQLEQLWLHLQQEEFSKTDLLQLDAKLSQLARQLKTSQYLNTVQLEKVAEICTFYEQYHLHSKNRKIRNKSVEKYQHSVEFENKDPSLSPETSEDMNHSIEDWESEKFQRERTEHQRKRLAHKREQAEKLAEQSLKTVYLKITVMIHPDREPDEAKKLEKTELQQVVNEAYEQQDLFYLLKLQLQLETNQGKSSKALTDEHLKFYKMALDAQSQRLANQIDDITDALHWSDKPKPKNMQVKDVYKVIDGDVSVLKEQVKWEKERLKYMGKVSVVEMLLVNNVL